MADERVNAPVKLLSITYESERQIYDIYSCSLQQIQYILLPSLFRHVRRCPPVHVLKTCIGPGSQQSPYGPIPSRLAVVCGCHQRSPPLGLALSVDVTSVHDAVASSAGLEDGLHGLGRAGLGGPNEGSFAQGGVTEVEVQGMGIGAAWKSVSKIVH